MKIKCVLACEICASRNYTTSKPKEAQARLSVRKYCKTCEKHTIHQETK